MIGTLFEYKGSGVGTMKFLPISEDILGSAESSKTSFIKSRGADFADVFAEQVSAQSDVDAVVASNAPAMSEEFNSPAKMCWDL